MKKESELIVGNSDIMVKERIAFKVKTPGPKQFVINYPIPITNVKGRDKFGKIEVKIENSTNLRVLIKRQLSAPSVHAVELNILVQPNFEKIGSITVINWGSIDLYRIITLVKPFQVLGFGKSVTNDNQWIFINNLSKDIRSNIARFRSARVELGSHQEIKVQLTFSINCSSGGRVKSLSFFGPTSSKRQQSKLLTPKISVKHGKDGNPSYIYSNGINPGESKLLKINWHVTIPQGFTPNTDLGSMKALNILTKESPKYRKYLQSSQFWEVNHPQIQTIIQKIKPKSSIFNAHRLLFEFVNRHIEYTITNDRRTAVTALKTGKGDCSEYADLLVTLHRAMGIPSRVVEGIIIENDRRQNPEGHAYVEFLTTKGWVPSDPTWGILLGTTCQHIEFTHQRTESIESKIYSLQYSGPEPKVDYQINWSPVE